MKQEIISNLKVNNNEIRVMRVNNEDYISLTELARKRLELLYNNKSIKELEKTK